MLRVVGETSVKQDGIAVPAVDVRPLSRLFLVLGNPRHATGSSRSLAIKMGAGVPIPVPLQVCGYTVANGLSNPYHPEVYRAYVA